MSRSALVHQERNVNRRSKEAEEAWEQAIEEGRNNRAKNLIPLSGPDDSFRIEPMLLSGIKKSQYFLKLCQEISTWTALVDEIYYQVDGIEPWALGGVKSPSKAFCLLVRLLTMRSTSNQMELMLNHEDSPYIRAIGFLYLRYTCDPAHLFKWLKPYLFDNEPMQISGNKKSAGGRGNGRSEDTVGSFVRSLLSSNRDFHGTTLPRLPAQIERDMQVQLLQAEKVEKRAGMHSRDKQTMDYFQKLGSKVVATYEDEDNPLQWYTAEVDRVVLRGEDGNLLKYPKYVVTFTEYGNTETVLLGEMDLPDGKFYREDQYGGGRGGGDQRGGGRNALYDEVRRRERDTVTASGRGGYYSRPPPSTKESLSGGGRDQRSDRRRHSPSPPYRKRSPPREADRAGSDNRGSGDRPSQNNPPPRKRTAEEVAVIQEKKRKLMAKYG